MKKNDKALKNKINHVGILSKNLHESTDLFEKLGITFDECLHIPTYQTDILKSKSPVKGIELICPYVDNETMFHYIDKHGNALNTLHHICIETNDIERYSKILKKNGLKLIHSKARTGEDGYLVNFIHPKSFGGVLIEIVQKIS